MKLKLKNVLKNILCFFGCHLWEDLSENSSNHWSTKRCAYCGATAYHHWLTNTQISVPQKEILKKE